MLNEEQRRVVEHLEGPALVVAGPGSGKTRTVVHRTARLLERGVSPEEITLVTFTKKAAGEMQERLGGLVGEEVAGRVWTSTFHSLAASILREAGPLRILDAEAAQKVIGRILRRIKRPKPSYQKPPSAKVVQGAISRGKNAGWDEKELRKKYADLEPYLGEAYRVYEAFKEEHGLLDFDDLLIAATKVLEENPGLQERWQAQARFLTVDEFQDTNLQQFRLLSLLLGPEENIVAVGDPNQAIYSWRGADHRLILEFKRHFPGAKVYHLATNYRSHDGIVAAALGLIRHNEGREDLPLRATREGPLPLKVTATSREGEALFVAEAAQKALAEGVPPSEIAVLMRSLSISRPLEAALRRLRIPHTVVGSVGFWARKEVRLVLSLLRASYGDPVGLLEALELALGKVPKELEEDPWKAKDLPEALPLMEALEGAQALHGLVGGALPPAFTDWLERERSFLWPILLEFAEGDKEKALDRWDHLEEVGNALKGFAETTPKGDLALFLQDVLLSQADPQGGGEGVRLMTLHASKGLEFHTVFVVGLVEGLFPSRRSLGEPDGLEEERRLLYVGLTRAKEVLYLTTYLMGDRGSAWPSRFLAEVPGRSLEYNPRIGFYGEEETQVANSLAELGSLDW